MGKRESKANTKVPRNCPAYENERKYGKINKVNIKEDIQHE